MTCHKTKFHNELRSSGVVLEVIAGSVVEREKESITMPTDERNAPFEAQQNPGGGKPGQGNPGQKPGGGGNPGQKPGGGGPGGNPGQKPGGGGNPGQKPGGGGNPGQKPGGGGGR